MKDAKRSARYGDSFISKNPNNPTTGNPARKYRTLLPDKKYTTAASVKITDAVPMSGSSMISDNTSPMRRQKARKRPFSLFENHAAKYMASASFTYSAG